MKRRMFLSTMIMTLLLLVSLTTATFAWYSAATGSVTKNADDTAALQAEGNSYKQGTVTVTVTINPFETSEKPVLTDEEGNTYYFTGAGQTLPVLDPSATPKSVSTEVLVSASMTESSLTLTQALAAIGNPSFTLTIKVDKIGKLGKDANTAQTIGGQELTYTVTSEQLIADNFNETIYVGLKGDATNQTPENIGQVTISCDIVQAGSTPETPEVPQHDIQSETGHWVQLGADVNDSHEAVFDSYILEDGKRVGEQYIIRNVDAKAEDVVTLRKEKVESGFWADPNETNGVRNDNKYIKTSGKKDIYVKEYTNKGGNNTQIWVSDYAAVTESTFYVQDAVQSTWNDGNNLDGKWTDGSHNIWCWVTNGNNTNARWVKATVVEGETEPTYKVVTTSNFINAKLGCFKSEQTQEPDQNWTNKEYEDTNSFEIANALNKVVEIGNQQSQGGKLDAIIGGEFISNPKA